MKTATLNLSRRTRVHANGQTEYAFALTDGARVVVGPYPEDHAAAKRAVLALWSGEVI